MCDDGDYVSVVGFIGELSQRPEEALRCALGRIARARYEGPVRGGLMPIGQELVERHLCAVVPVHALSKSIVGRGLHSARRTERRRRLDRPAHRARNDARQLVVPQEPISRDLRLHSTAGRQTGVPWLTLLLTVLDDQDATDHGMTLLTGFRTESWGSAPATSRTRHRSRRGRRSEVALPDRHRAHTSAAFRRSVRWRGSVPQPIRSSRPRGPAGPLRSEAGRLMFS